MSAAARPAALTWAVDLLDCIGALPQRGVVRVDRACADVDEPDCANCC